MFQSKRTGPVINPGPYDTSLGLRSIVLRCLPVNVRLTVHSLERTAVMIITAAHLRVTISHWDLKGPVVYSHCAWFVYVDVCVCFCVCVCVFVCPMCAVHLLCVFCVGLCVCICVCVCVCVCMFVCVCFMCLLCMCSACFVCVCERCVRARVLCVSVCVLCLFHVCAVRVQCVFRVERLGT